MWPLRSSLKAVNALLFRDTKTNSSNLEVCITYINLIKANMQISISSRKELHLVCTRCQLLQLILGNLGTQQHKQRFEWQAAHFHTYGQF